MAIDRQKALARLKGLATQVQEHLQEIANHPDSWDVPHWTREVKNWLNQMEKMLAHIGKRTARQWAEQLDDWKSKLEEPEE